MRTLARRSIGWSAAAALLLLSGGGTATAQRPGREGAAAQPVNFPHVMRDNFNMNWDVQMDGSIGDGGNDQYDGGGRLMVNGQQYQSPNGQGMFNPQANEVTLSPVPMNGLTVHRRVAVSQAGGWCRFTEVLENAGTTPVKANVHIHFDLGGAINQQQAVNEPKKNTPIGLTIFDGQRGVGMLGGGRGGKVACRYQPQPNSDQCALYYDVEVPAKQSAVIVHFQAWRPSMAEAQQFVSSATEKELLGDMPKEIRRALVNFRRVDNALADIELPRQDVLDVVELRGGDQYRGTLKDASYKLQTFHGEIELPASRVVGMLSSGVYRPTQLFVTSDGEIIGGTLQNEAISIALSSGQVLKLPVSAISKVGCRKRPGEPEELKIDKPMAMFRDGQRIGVEMPESPVAVNTLYGTLQIRPETLHSISFVGDDQPVHQVRLRDGSKFSALLTSDSLSLRLRGSGASGTGPATGGSAVSFPLASVARFQFSPPDAEPEDPEAPTVSLKNNDVLIGALAGTFELDTGFDVIKINGAEVTAVAHVEPPAAGGTPHPGDITVTLWDGATVSGRVRGDAVEVALKSGASLKVPVALLDRYDQPRPAPSADMVVRIGKLVEEQSAEDWKARDRAADQLRTLGVPVIGVLKELRAKQSPEGIKLIDGIIAAIEAEKKKAAAPTTPPAQPRRLFR
jgi:hypothetical protein